MAPDPIDRHTARSSTWHEVCTAWDLVDRDDLTVVLENMPPGTSAEPHRHRKARQFFYVLAGTGTMRMGPRTIQLAAGMGLEIPARTLHHMSNKATEDLEFLAITAPKDPGRKHVKPGSGAAGQPGLVVGSHLRATRSSDLPALLELENALDTRQWLGAGGQEWHRQMMEDVDTEHSVLVDRLDRILAFGVLVGLTTGGSAVELRRMAVAPEGRGQGLGRLLLRYLLEHARADPSVRTVWLEVLAENARAQHLYRSFGFVISDPPESVQLTQDDTVYMEWTEEV